jgi:phage regulator Rha-like protein
MEFLKLNNIKDFNNSPIVSSRALLNYINELEEQRCLNIGDKFIERRHYDMVQTINEHVENLGKRNIPLSKYFKETTYRSVQNKELKEYLLTKRGIVFYLGKLTDVMGAGFMDSVLNYIEKIELEIETLRFKQGSKIEQVEAMESLYNILSEEERCNNVNYIKINMITNKATSNFFGHQKLIRKDAMSLDMLEKRSEILVDCVRFI